jgi:DNA-binding transcriptional LysR family regulator
VPLIARPVRIPDEVAALGRDAAGVLRLASFPTAAATLCPPVINRLTDRFPRHVVTLAEMEPPNSLRALAAGKIDLAIVDEPALPVAGLQTGLRHVEVYADPLYCVMRPNHSATSMPAVNLTQLASEEWIMDDPACSFYRLTVGLCHAAGFEPNIVANTESVSVYSALVRAGAGIAILPGLALATMGGDLTYRPIAPRIVRRIYAVYRKGSDTRPSMAAALELLRETAEMVGGAHSAPSRSSKR